MLGVSPARAPELYRDASPADLITKDTPPVLILHGAQDPLVPVSQARVLKRALDANRVPNQLFIIPGAKHGFGFKVTRYDLLAATATFLDRALNA
jgi:dipeptidyl aminopeptidase/acylaminoacyl peptidase